jgi:hypothetical protein
MAVVADRDLDSVVAWGRGHLQRARLVLLVRMENDVVGGLGHHRLDVGDPPLREPERLSQPRDGLSDHQDVLGLRRQH